MEVNNFTYFDRGIWYLEIDDNTVKDIGNGMINAHYTDILKQYDNIKRVANGFLSNGVIGKFNQYCGVKCIKYGASFYLLEGDQADGYCVHNISKDVMNAAAGEVCEAVVKLFIENEAIIRFYRLDGSGYKSYEPIDFLMLHDRKIYYAIMQQYPDYSWDVVNR